MGKVFSDDVDPETGRHLVRDREALESITIDGRAGTRRKVTDESNERVWAQRVESDTERSLNITPRTVDFKMVEA